MVVAAYDEIVVFCVTGCLSDVVVGVCRVIKEAVFDGTFGDAHSDTVGAIECHLGDDGELLQRYTGGFDSIGADDGVAVLSTDLDVFA